MSKLQKILTDFEWRDGSRRLNQYEAEAAIKAYIQEGIKKYVVIL